MYTEGGKNHNLVIFEVQGNIGWITLNRPEVLNALSISMAKSTYAQLSLWKDEPEIHAIVIQGAGEKAFCAGGNLKVTYELMCNHKDQLLSDILREEYHFNLQAHVYPKPLISFIDGIAMGAGLGLAMNCPFRIVTEYSLIAMPEVAIGYFPDAGASYFLNQCPASIGTYLGLTGNHIHGGDALYTGLATHFIHRAQLASVAEAMISQDFKDSNAVSSLLESFSTPGPQSILMSYESLIARCFNQKSLDNILNALRKEDNEFAQEILKTMLTRSPTSLYVTFEQLKRGKTMNFAQALKMEFGLAQAFFKDSDFSEGIRAMLIDKDHNPQWNPSTLEEVSEERVQSFFTA